MKLNGYQGIANAALALQMDQGLSFDKAERAVKKMNVDLHGYTLKEINQFNKFLLRLTTDLFDAFVLYPIECDHDVLEYLKRHARNERLYQLYSEMMDEILMHIGT